MDAALKILVVEDHEDLREVTIAALSSMGYAVRGVDCAEALDQQLPAFRPDIIVLDLNLPGEDGLSIARRLRRAHPDIGIVMVTARNQPRDVTLGYTSGADIYVTKPASPEELQAAILALTRRMRPQGMGPGNDLYLDPRKLQLRGPVASINVSDHESLLLTALAQARDQRLETWQLLELSGKSFEEADKKTLAVQIVRLRKKLDDAGAPQPTIKSIRGTGYQLCVSLQVEG